MNEWTNGEMDVDTGWNDGCVDVWGWQAKLDGLVHG